MIPEIILAIAQLCILPNGINVGTNYGQHKHTIVEVEQKQLACQVFFIDCLLTNQYTLKTEANADKLATCITLRRLEK